MANELIHTIDASKDDSVNLRVGLAGQAIVDVKGYGGTDGNAILTDVCTGDSIEIKGEVISHKLGIKYEIPEELVRNRTKYLMDLGSGKIVSVYVTKRQIEHVIEDARYFVANVVEEVSSLVGSAIVGIAVTKEDTSSLVGSAVVGIAVAQ